MLFDVNYSAILQYPEPPKRQLSGGRCVCPLTNQQTGFCIASTQGCKGCSGQVAAYSSGELPKPLDSSPKHLKRSKVQKAFQTRRTWYLFEEQVAGNLLFVSTASSSSRGGIFPHRQSFLTSLAMCFIFRMGFIQRKTKLWLHPFAFVYQKTLLSH